MNSVSLSRDGMAASCPEINKQTPMNPLGRPSLNHTTYTYLSAVVLITTTMNLNAATIVDTDTLYVLTNLTPADDSYHTLHFTARTLTDAQKDLLAQNTLRFQTWQHYRDKRDGGQKVYWVHPHSAYTKLSHWNEQTGGVPHPPPGATVQIRSTYPYDSIWRDGIETCTGFAPKDGALRSEFTQLPGTDCVQAPPKHVHCHFTLTGSDGTPSVLPMGPLLPGQEGHATGTISVECSGTKDATVTIGPVTMFDDQPPLTGVIGDVNTCANTHSTRTLSVTAAAELCLKISGSFNTAGEHRLGGSVVVLYE